jgi:hypothetical protein
MVKKGGRGEFYSPKQNSHEKHEKAENQEEDVYGGFLTMPAIVN